MLFPYFISWIIVGMVALALFDEDTGMINSMLIHFGGEAVEWYSNADYWWAIMIFTTVWKGAGYGSIIYYCALSGFDQSLYEAAEIDGAGRWKRITKITIPLLKPTIMTMFLLNIGGILSGSVDQIMGMTNLNPFLLEKRTRLRPSFTGLPSSTVSLSRLRLLPCISRYSVSFWCWEPIFW